MDAVGHDAYQFVSILLETASRLRCFNLDSFRVIKVTEFIKRRFVRILSLERLVLCELDPLVGQDSNFLAVLGQLPLVFKFLFLLIG